MNQKIYLRFQTSNKQSFKTFLQSFKTLACLKVSSISLPIEKKKYTVLRSPHVYKKAKDQFEVRFYNGIIIIKFREGVDISLKTIQRFLKPEIMVKISYIF